MKLKVLLVQSEMGYELNFRQQSKEGLAKTAGNITENLMSIAKMMESQVQQSRNNTEVLSKYFPTTENPSLPGCYLPVLIHFSSDLIQGYN